MKKIKLIGKKLYRVGPLKCFKDNHHGHGTGGVYSSSRPQGYGSGSGGGSYMGSDRHSSSQGDSYRKNQARIKAAAAAAAAKAAKEKKERINKMMVEDPTAFKGLMKSGDADAIAAANEQENKKVAQIKQDVGLDKKIQNLLKKGLVAGIAGVLDVAGLGVVNIASALASEISPQKKEAILNSLDENVPGVKAAREFLKQQPTEVTQADIDSALDSGKYDNPANPTIFEGSARTQTNIKEQRGGDKYTPPPIAGVKVAAQADEKVVPETPKTPSTMTEAELEGMLAKRARGEDSIVEKESKLARERGLTQQLSSIRGARGVTSGQKLRALRRGQGQMNVQLGSQTAIAKAREQQAAQDAYLGLKRGDRKDAEKFLHQKGSATYKGTGSGGGGGAPGQTGLQKFGSGMKTGIDIIKSGKKIWDLGKSFFDEGGKVIGPGSETSDSIPARLSDGEFVVKASAVRGLGKSLGAKDKEDQREKGVEFLYKLQDKMDKKVEKFGGGGEIKADPERFLKFMDKGVSWSLNKKNIQKSHLPKEKKKALLEKLGEEPKFAKGGEAYVRPKKAFREAIGYEPESRFHDKAEKDAKFGGARRKFRHFKHGGEASYGDVIAAQKDLNRRLEKLEKRK